MKKIIATILIASVIIFVFFLYLQEKNHLERKIDDLEDQINGSDNRFSELEDI